VYGKYSLPVIQVDEQHHDENNICTISSISHQALGRYCCVGDFVVGINNIPCTDAEILGWAWNTHCSPNEILVENPTGYQERISVLFCRSEEDECLGIAIRKQQHQWVLSRTGNSSLFEKGDIVLTVKDISCADMDAATLALL